MLLPTFHLPLTQTPLKIGVFFSPKLDGTEICFVGLRLISMRLFSVSSFSFTFGHQIASTLSMANLFSARI